MEGEIALRGRDVSDIQLRSNATYPYVDEISMGMLPEKGDHGRDEIIACIAARQGNYTVVAFHIEANTRVGWKTHVQTEEC